MVCGGVDHRLLRADVGGRFAVRDVGHHEADLLARGSLAFGLGHIFGALGQPIVTVIAKTVWATALGVYLGAVYVKTGNLWVPIILHFIVNLCGIPFCFSTTTHYPTIALITCLVSYVLLGIYGVSIVRKRDSHRS